MKSTCEAKSPSSSGIKCKKKPKTDMEYKLFDGKDVVQKDTLIEYIEPEYLPDGSYVTRHVSFSAEDIVKLGRAYGTKYKEATDEIIIEDFMVIHWGMIRKEND